MSESASLSTFAAAAEFCPAHSLDAIRNETRTTWKISGKAIATFGAMFWPGLGLSVALSAYLTGLVALGPFQTLALVAVAFVTFFAFNVVAYRIYFFFAPLPNGTVVAGSKGHFSHQVYNLFNVFFFYPIWRSYLIVITPLSRLFFMALGAKIGETTYSSGFIMDPFHTEIGSNTFLGADCKIIAHVLEGEKIEFHPIKIGSNVTIGANAIVFAGTTIDDHAIIAAGSVVSKGSKVGKNELWIGNPARCVCRK